MILDGSIVDMATIGVRFIPPVIRILFRFKTGKTPYFIREQAITDMLNGVMLVPFIISVPEKPRPSGRGGKGTVFAVQN